MAIVDFCNELVKMFATEYAANAGTRVHAVPKAGLALADGGWDGKVAAIY